MEFSFSPKLLVVAVAAALPLIASAADTPSTATARKGFAGYDHPNQYLVKPATTIADNMMPVMQHPAQDKETQQKLAELEKKPVRNRTWLFSCWMMWAGWTLALTAAAWRWVTLHQISTPLPARADFNFGVFSTEFFPNPRHDSHRTILHPPRHSDAANVRATGRSARVNHAAAVAARSGLRHPGYREMAYGGKQRVAAAERWL